MIVCINATTLAVSEYDLDANGVADNDGEVFVSDSAGLYMIDPNSHETVQSEVATGQLDFATTVGKRCPNITPIAGVPGTPTVSIWDDVFDEYDTAIRQGYTDKYTRMYDSPRGVLSTRIGFRVQGTNLDFTKLNAHIVTSADK